VLTTYQIPVDHNLAVQTTCLSDIRNTHFNIDHVDKLNGWSEEICQEQ
jgi:hypothetical protein